MISPAEATSSPIIIEFDADNIGQPFCSDGSLSFQKLLSSNAPVPDTPEALVHAIAGQRSVSTMSLPDILVWLVLKRDLADWQKLACILLRKAFVCRRFNMKFLSTSFGPNRGVLGTAISNARFTRNSEIFTLSNDLLIGYLKAFAEGIKPIASRFHAVGGHWLNINLMHQTAGPTIDDVLDFFELLTQHEGFATSGSTEDLTAFMAERKNPDPWQIFLACLAIRNYEFNPLYFDDENKRRLFQGKFLSAIDDSVAGRIHYINVMQSQGCDNYSAFTMCNLGPIADFLRQIGHTDSPQDTSRCISEAITRCRNASAETDV